MLTLQRAQHRYRQTEDQEVCDNVYTCHEQVEIRKTLLVGVRSRITWSGGDDGDSQ